LKWLWDIFKWLHVLLKMFYEKLTWFEVIHWVLRFFRPDFNPCEPFATNFNRCELVRSKMRRTQTWNHCENVLRRASSRLSWRGNAPTDGRRRFKTVKVPFRPSDPEFNQTAKGAPRNGLEGTFEQAIWQENSCREREARITLRVKWTG